YWFVSKSCEYAESDMVLFSPDLWYYHNNPTLRMSQPQIVIDPDEELHIVCKLLFYNIPGFHSNAKKLHKVCQEEGYSFRLQDITKWVNTNIVTKSIDSYCHTKLRQVFRRLRFQTKFISVIFCSILTMTRMVKGYSFVVF